MNRRTTTADGGKTQEKRDEKHEITNSQISHQLHSIARSVVNTQSIPIDTPTYVSPYINYLFYFAYVCVCVCATVACDDVTFSSFASEYERTMISKRYYCFMMLRHCIRRMCVYTQYANPTAAAATVAIVAAAI